MHDHFIQSSNSASLKNLMLTHLVQDEGVCVSVCEAREIHGVQSLEVVQCLFLLVLTAKVSVSLVQRTEKWQVFDHGGQVGGQHLLFQSQANPCPSKTEITFSKTCSYSNLGKTVSIN